jgi:TetR/AcrR family transcriptional regulator of autoinduction and epiphytic fitness
MPRPAAAPAPPPDDGRRRGLLEAAIGVFARYGFRKTSMEEVARAAQVSRQGLYLHFATKEELFRAAVTHLLARSLTDATLALRAPEASLEERLVGACDAWIGRYVGMFQGSAADLLEAATKLIGPCVSEHEARFVEALARTVSNSGLAAAYRPAGLTARQLTETLVATARGFKHSSASPEAFSKSMRAAVRALCLPLAAR